MKHYVVSIAVLLVGSVTGIVVSFFAEAANFNMTCNAVSSTLTLNAFDPLNPTPVSTPTGSITVSCTSTSNSSTRVDYTLQLNAGTRQLTNGTNTLDYIAYTNSGLTIPWSGTTGTCAANSNTNVGNVICGSFTVPAKSTATQIKNYYAKVPTSGSSDVTVGTYTQTTGVTLIYNCVPAPTGSGTC